MANYLYNGVELPDINAVWTNKTKYLYAHIHFSNDKYWLTIVGKKPYYTEEFMLTVGARIDSPYERYKLDGDTWVFSSTSDEYDYDVATTIDVSATIWTSYDLLDKAGKLYFSASEPVPVVPEPEPEPEPELGPSWQGKDIYMNINGSWVKCKAVKASGDKWVEQDGYAVE